MDAEDYPSDSEASDEDFRPDKDGESGSEIESDDDIPEEEIEDKTGTKRKQNAKHCKNKKLKEEVINKPKDPLEEPDDEEEKQLSDALWADFLAGTGSSNSSTSTATKETNKKSAPSSSAPVEAQKKVEVTKVFEFAGEKVEVTEQIEVPNTDKSTDEVSKPVLAAVSSNSSPVPPRPLGRPARGGLGSVLSQIGKKNKLSTLEKTKLDWNSFKRNEGIEEELQTHNKGRDGFLERQDFLQRADLRQFEIEKNFRQTKRSNR